MTNEEKMNKNYLNGLTFLFIILVLGSSILGINPVPTSDFNEKNTSLLGPEQGSSISEDIPQLGPEDKSGMETKNHKPTVKLVISPQTIISGKPTLKDRQGLPILAIIEAIGSDKDGDSLTYTFTTSEGTFGPDFNNKLLVERSPAGRFPISVVVDDFKGGRAEDKKVMEVLTPEGVSKYEPTKNDNEQPFEQMGGPASFGTSTSTGASLTGDIYKIPEGSSQLPDFNALSNDDYLGSIYTKKLDIPARDFTEGFPDVTGRTEWFAIKYVGDFFISNEGDYEFRLLSDDGSRLLIDGEEIIKNDGIHPPNAFKGTEYLRKGQHHIEVDYFQGPRYQIALQLFWTPPGGNEVIFEPNYV